MYQAFTGGLGGIALAKHGKSRAINAENPHGEKGRGSRKTAGSREQDHQDLTVRWCAGRGNRYLRIRYRYPDHSVHGITIRSRMRHRQASNACICKLFCDDLR